MPSASVSLLGHGAPCPYLMRMLSCPEHSRRSLQFPHELSPHLRANLLSELSLLASEVGALAVAGDVFVIRSFRVGSKPLAAATGAFNLPVVLSGCLCSGLVHTVFICRSDASLTGKLQ